MFYFVMRTLKQLIFTLLLLIALLFSTIRLLFCYADGYKNQIQTQLSVLLETPVTIGHISASMRGLHPQLRLQNISLAAQTPGTQPALTMQEIRLTLNLLEIWRKSHWLLASTVTLVGAKFTLLHQLDGKVVISGLKSSNGEPLWLLQGKHYALLNSDITWQEQQQPQHKIQFNQIDVLLKNDLTDAHHQVHILSHAINPISDKLRISLDFTGSPFNPASLHANFYAQIKNLHLEPLLKTSLPAQWRFRAGGSNVEGWGTWQHNSLSAFTGNVDTQRLTIQRPDKKRLHINRLSSQFSWQNQANRWTLAVDNLQLISPHTARVPLQFVLGSPNRSAQHIACNIKQLDLHALTTYMQFFAPVISHNNAWLTTLALSGQLHNAEFFADLTAHHYAVRGQVKHLSLHSSVPALQLHNVSAFINGTQQQGTLWLDTQQANFVAQNLFRTPLKINQLTGKLSWLQTETNWQFSSENLKLTTPYLRSAHQLKLIIPKNQQPSFIDLNTTFADLQVNQAKTYFPTTLMSQGLVDYLDHAFIAGQATDGRMVLYGQLADFPFRQHQGVFQILFNAHHVTMHYAPQWPLFEQLEARVMFLNDSVEIALQQAMARRAMLYATTIRIPSFHDSDYLLAQGNVRAAINDGLDFLQHTPLHLPLTALAKQVTFNGNTEVALDLAVALSDKVTSKVTGRARLQDAQLNVLAVNLPITHLSGDLKFTQQRFYSDELRAVALKQPIRAQIIDRAQQMDIKVDGTVSTAALQEHFSLKNQQIAQGTSPYQLQLSLPVAPSAAAQLHIQSPLQGIRLTLPDGLAKTAAETKPLHLTFNLGNPQFLPIQINYADQLKAALSWQKTDKKLFAGALLFGQGSVEIPDSAGLTVKIQQTNFTPLAWLGLMNTTASSDSETAVLRELELHTQQLHWHEAQLGAVDLSLHHLDNDWTAQIHSPLMKGRLQWLNDPRHEHKYLLHLEHLDLSSLLKLKLPQQTVEVSEKKLPLLDIRSEKVLLRGVNLGKFELTSQRSGNGVQFPAISLTSKNRKLTLSGDWQLEHGQPQTRLQGQLVAHKFGNLLKRLDLYNDFKETNAEIGLALQWQGAPYQFALAGLNGTVDVKLTEGRILSIEPGFGRLLGVLAMGQWIKRLQLDFGDIYKEGLSFDTISGHFALNNGKASSRDLTVDAVAATINLTGEVDLGEQTLNQDITVIPKSADALPIAGMIVGNIATVVTQTLTGEYEDGYYLRSKYNVHGKWSDLNVISLYEQDGLLHKIGRGLTDFSWMDAPD